VALTSKCTLFWNAIIEINMYWYLAAIVQQL